MKKYFTSKEWKANSIRSKARSSYCKVRRKDYLNRKRFLDVIKSELTSPIRRIAPENFSLIENPNEIISFFNETKDLINEKNDIFIDLKNIENLTPDAVALLCATINDKHFVDGRSIRGNSPQKDELAHLFKGSGFFNHVSSKDKPKLSNSNIAVHKITNNKVENDLAKEICEMIVFNALGMETKFRPLYEIFIELMANTNNHAALGQAGEYHWWLFIDDNGDNCVRISFLDLGVGIIDSGPVQNYINSIFTNIGARSDSTIMEDIFNGKLKSRTNLDERGKGLPLIFKRSKIENFSKFFLVSNKAYVDLKAEKFKELKSGFKGTFWYLELTN